MANMSYCQFENTMSALRQVRDTMDEAENIEALNLNEYERDAFERMPQMLAQLQEHFDRIMEMEGN